jgi:hypothetical protein
VVALVLLQDRDCAVCTRQAEWGCNARQDAGDQGGAWLDRAVLPIRIDGEEVWRCPRRPIKDDPGYWRRLLFFYGMYRKGHLPDPGAVSEQSNKAMQLFAIVDDVVAACAAEEARSPGSPNNHGPRASRRDAGARR